MYKKARSSKSLSASKQLVSAQHSESAAIHLQTPTFPVLRAHDLSRRIFPFSKKRRFYVTLTDGSTIKQTAAVQSAERAVEWNEELDALWDIAIS